MTETNCPFYGHSMFVTFQNPEAEMAYYPFLLLDSHGNQCALKTRRHSPCVMEPDQIDWRDCPIAKDIRPKPVPV